MSYEAAGLPWSWVIGCTLAATTLWVACATIDGEAAILLPAGLLLGAGGTYLVWQAALRKRWALLTLLVIGPTLLSMTFRKRDIGSPGLDWQVAMKAVAWIAMFAVFVVNLTSIRRFMVDRVMVAFACLCVMLDISAIYSPAPLVTGLAAFAMTAYLGFACVCVNELPERTIVLCLLWAMSLTCIVNVVSPLFVPDMAYGQNEAELLAGAHAQVTESLRLQGLFGQPNILGRYVSVFAYVILAAACRGFVRPLIWVPNALLAAALLLATESRGTLIAVFIAAVLLIPRRYLVIVVALGIAAGVALSSGGALQTVLSLVGRNGDASEAVDMAGRAELWSFVWGLIRERPLLGYGFNSFEVYAGPLWTGQLQAGVAAHNNYLSMLYCNGIIGTIPFALGFLILLRRWLWEPDMPRDFLVLSTLVCGYAEMDVPSFAFVPSLIFFMMIAMDAKRRLALADVAANRAGSAVVSVGLPECVNP